MDPRGHQTPRHRANIRQPCKHIGILTEASASPRSGIHTCFKTTYFLQVCSFPPLAETHLVDAFPTEKVADKVSQWRLCKCAQSWSAKVALLGKAAFSISVVDSRKAQCRGATKASQAPTGFWFPLKRPNKTALKEDHVSRDTVLGHVNIEYSVT